jgi:aminoglycoside phosphotransferase (APT) family kinase protein
MSAEIADSLSNELDRKTFLQVREKFPRAEIVHFSRQTRWRPSWDIELQDDSGRRRLIVRAEKGKNYVSPISLQQEADIHHILERHGIAVPHVHGMLDDPVAIIMDVVPGQINLATAINDAARENIRSQYVHALSLMHRIPLREFAAAGFTIPEGPREIALNLYEPCERIYRRRMAGRPFALMDFIWRWVTRNVPAHRNRAAFITADSGQFLFDGDQLTGLIDFEVGYVGDPLAEFAGMRLRDSTEPLGDIGALMDRYEQLTGDKLDKFSVEYHTAGFCAVNGFLLWPLAFDPDANDDYVAYLSFSVGTSRWSISAIAAAMGVQLQDAQTPVAAPLSYPAAARHLVGVVGALSGRGPQAGYDLGKAVSLALYAERANTYGRSIMQDNLNDASQLLGRPLRTPEEAELALIEFIAHAGPEHDAALLQYFHRWLGRQDFLLRACGASAYLTGMDLQKIAER